MCSVEMPPECDPEHPVNWFRSPEWYGLNQLPTRLISAKSLVNNRLTGKSQRVRILQLNSNG